MLTSSTDSAIAARRDAIADALDFLVSAERDRISLDAAHRTLGLLRNRHPSVDMELLWEEQRHTGTMHYDVLLRPPGGGTVSLGYAAENAVPWLVRTAQHSRDSDIARVNSQTLDLQTVMSYLDVLWNDTRLMEQMVDDMLIGEAIDQYRIEVAPDEVQRALDDLRASLGLLRADDTTRWMARHGMSRERLENLATRGAATALLRERVIDDAAVTHYLESRGSDLDSVRIARFRVADVVEGQRAVAAINAGEADFFEMAAEAFVGGDREPARGGETFFATATRRSLSPAQADQLFAAERGEVLGPVASGDGHDVVRILAVARVRPDDPVARTAARLALFDDWLAERRKNARVEWFWGHADHAPVA